MRKLFWILVALTGAFAIGGIALHRGESINAMWIVVALVVLFIVGGMGWNMWTHPDWIHGN